MVARTMKRDISPFGDEGDLFEHGADRYVMSLFVSINTADTRIVYSLQATWIRNTIVRALRESHPKLVHTVTSNLVYENPTISSLANQVVLVIAGHAISEANSLSAKKDELLKLVEKYTNSFPDFIPAPKENTGGHVVLLTGATGSLGSNLLAVLLQSNSVSVVYTRSRRFDKPVLDRLKSALRKRTLLWNFCIATSWKFWKEIRVNLVSELSQSAIWRSVSVLLSVSCN